jgi:disulfide oxidoreductase YuzD
MKSIEEKRAEEIKAPSETGEKPTQVLKDLVSLDYEDFVKKLGEMADDPKLHAAIKAGKRDGDVNDEKVKFHEKSLPVKKLTPTQNEVDVDKSLMFPLTKTESPFIDTTEKILKSGHDPRMKDPIEIMAPIVTLNEKYIIDGHHRWSQIYAMNQEAKISVIDMKTTDDPIKILKAVQLSIAVAAEKIPVEKVEGTNLLKVDEEKLKSYVVNNIADEVLELMGSEYKKIKTKEDAAEFIWNNVKTMQETSQPIKGAPERQYMPQTDQAEGWEEPLKRGRINFKGPFKKPGAPEPVTERRIYDFEKFVNEEYNQMLQRAHVPSNSMERKPSEWSEITKTVSKESVKNLPRYFVYDLYAVETSDDKFPAFTRFENTPEEDEFVLIFDEGEEEYLVKRAGYDYAKYAAKINTK